MDKKIREYLKKLGSIGGKKSSSLMSPRQRSKRAKKAARIRWKRYREEKKKNS